MKLRRSLLFLSPLILSAAFFARRPVAQAESPQNPKPSAPELIGTQWINTPGQKPISLFSRRGKVTIVEFWTFGCSNCRANLPAYAKWARDYAARGVEVIGVHTPETAAERNPKNVAAQVKELGITYPVLLDSQNRNWNRYKTQYWPTIYVLDQKNQIQFKWEGELESGGAGGTAKINQIVEKLLAKPLETANSTQKIMKITKTDAQWRAELSPAAYDVLRHEGTERAFSGSLLNVHDHGVFKCAGCGLELFSSDAKFDSGTGWPSFFQPIHPGAVEEKSDYAFGMKRTAIECPRCGGHLGHVFDDGPKPTGLRYCMNSVALTFEKK